MSLAESYNELVSLAGQKYLSSGGPSSRFEEIVLESAQRLSLKTDVYATPTGLIVTSISPGDAQKALTRLSRIELGSTRLSDLIEIEKVFSELRPSSTLENAKSSIRSIGTETTYPNWLLYLCVFATGFSVSFPQFGNPFAAVLCGIGVVLLSWVTGPLAQKWRINGILGEFLAGLVALIFANSVSTLFGLLPESILIGSLIFLAPGLTLTIAVSELAEQNLVSGTAKLMRGILAVLALGSAYYLFSDLSSLIGFAPKLAHLSDKTHSLSLHHQFIFNAMALMAWSVVFSIPARHILPATIVGCLSWLFLSQLSGAPLTILTSLAPAFLVGFISYVVSRHTEVPSQIYSVPGVFVLLPGMLALSSFLGTQNNQTSSIAFQVAIVLGGIVFGLLSARIPAQLLSKTPQ